MSQTSYHGYRFAGTFPDETARFQFHMEKWLRYHTNRKNSLTKTATMLIFSSILLVLAGMFSVLFTPVFTLSFLFVAVMALVYPLGCMRKAMIYQDIAREIHRSQGRNIQIPRNWTQTNWMTAFQKIVDIHRHSPMVMNIAEELAERETRRGLSRRP